MRTTRSSAAKAKPSATPPAPAPTAVKPKPKTPSKTLKAKARAPKAKPAVKHAADQDDEMDDGEDEDQDELAYFEHQRLSNIKRNQSLFSDLLVGTGGSASSILATATPTAKRSATKRGKAAADSDADNDRDTDSENASKTKKMRKTAAEPAVRRSSRASLRLRGLNPTGTSDPPAATARAVDNDNDDDDSTPTLDGPILSLSETTRTLDRASQLLASLATQGTRVHDAAAVDDDVEPAAVGSLAALFANLRIQHATPTIKLTPSRIATMCIAPLDDRYLACAGDKQGTLALCDMTAHVLDPTNADLDAGVQLKPHADSISAVHFTSPKSLVTASYDGSVRVLDVATQKFVLAAKMPRGVHVQALDSQPADPQVVWYSTDVGGLGVLDLRAPSPPASGVYPRVDQGGVCEKKIGSVSIHPTRGERVVVASNDTYARVFDVRYAFHGETSGFGEYRERAWYKHAYSCTAAYWRPRDGRGMCTTSYDDLVRVWDGEVAGEGEEGEEMKAPTSALRHDNKTGRWVTLFRAKYHPTLQDCLLIGNMQRHIDVIDASVGRVVATLGDPGITAVPAVTAVHPTSHTWANVVVGANASGKVGVWTPGSGGDENEDEDEQE